MTGQVWVMLVDDSKYASEVFSVLEAMLTSTEIQKQCQEIRDVCVTALQRKNKILLAGNGGSAADAQHFAGELVSRFNFDRPALAAIALTTDSSILTAVGNDYGFEDVFSRQVEALGFSGDVFIAISTSGTSENILNGVARANENKLFTIGLTGETGGDLRGMCDICVCVPSQVTPRIQECHLILEHLLCAGIEEAIFGGH